MFSNSLSDPHFFCEKQEKLNKAKKSENNILFIQQYYKKYNRKLDKHFLKL